MRLLKLNESYFCIIKEEAVFDKLKKNFMDKSKIKTNSFAEKYLIKLFEDIFKSALDIKKIYLDFYKEEYEKFSDFLYQKELLNEDEIKIINLHEDQTLLKLRMSLNSYNISTLFDHEDDFIKYFNQMLEEIDI